MCVCVCTCVVGRTDAGVVVDAVDAGGVVLAVVVFAVVRVHLAALALEARRTHTAANTHTHTHTHTHRHKHNARYKGRIGSHTHTRAAPPERKISQLLGFTRPQILALKALNENSLICILAGFPSGFLHTAGARAHLYLVVQQETPLHASFYSRY